MNWRIIDDGPSGGSWNMAVDEAILDAVAIGIAAPTIRFYRWDGPHLSIGKFQQIYRSIDGEACDRLGVPLVRRITGGRAVLHGGDLTVSAIVPVAQLGASGNSVVQSYRMISKGFALGFQRLAVSLDTAQCERRTDRPGDCFAARSAADMVDQYGQKLIGSAQCRRDGVILQQTSVKHLPGQVSASELFIGRVGDPAFPLARYRDDELRQALIAGFEQALGITLGEGSLCEWEYERAAAVLEAYGPVKLVDSGTGI